MTEVIAVIIFLIGGALWLSTPGPNEICSELERQGFTSSSYTNHLNCMTTIETRRNANLCHLESMIGTDFDGCMDRRTRALLEGLNHQPETIRFAQALSEKAKKEHRH